jgi:hypothetical protein
MPVEQALGIIAREVPGRLDPAAVAALETWLGRRTAPADAADPLLPGVLTLGGTLSAAPAEPETRPVVPLPAVPRV